MIELPDEAKQLFQKGALNIIRASLAYVRSPQAAEVRKNYGQRVFLWTVANITISGPRGIGHSKLLGGLAREFDEPVVVLAHRSYIYTTNWLSFKRSESEPPLPKKEKIFAIDNPDDQMSTMVQREVAEWWVSGKHGFDLMVTTQSKLRS